MKQKKALNGKKIGLFIHDQKNILALENIFSSLKYPVTTLSSPENIKEILKSLHILFIDEYYATDILGKLTTKSRKLGFFPIVLILENERNIEKWFQYDISDFIHQPFNRTEIILCLKRQTHLKKLHKNLTLIDHSIDLTHLAYHDALTGLYNRVMFEDAVDLSILSAQRRNEKIAIIFLDLDYFKKINDTMGHQKGDILLKAVSARILNCVRQTDSVARLGGDEFVILINGITKIEIVATIAQKIQEAFQQKFKINHREFMINASMGISIYPENGEDTETLIKNADIAMYLAKEHGRNNYQFCTAALSARIQERANIEIRLRHAIQTDELLLHYQPIIEIASGKITGIEAFLRWDHKEGELKYPLQFIPLAEETGLIVPIAEWVILKSCLESKFWQDAGYPSLALLINLSIINLRDRSIVEVVSKILKNTNFKADRLSFEISESTLMKDIESIMDVLANLKKLGIRIGVDDFGIGVSSLSYLKRLDIDYVKIDRTLIHNIFHSQDDAEIVTAIISMAHSLKIKVIAEGVETKSQLEFLSEKKCDECQGYFFCHPLSIQELGQYLKTHGENPSNPSKPK